ncbi:MAG: helix-turn-helix transcriptional regulator [Candidatus Hydrogenedentota bacterium]
MADTVLSNNVRDWRKTRGLTQTALAERVGITRQSIIAIEKGRLNPSIAVVLNLAAALEAGVEELFQLRQSEAPASGEAAFHIPAEPLGRGHSEDSFKKDAVPGSVWDFV